MEMEMEKTVAGGVSEEELRITCEVLRKLSNNKELYESKEMRMFRKAMNPIVNWALETRYGGKNPKELIKSVEQKFHTLREHSKREDRQKINSRTLRMARMRQLDALTEGSRLPLIPDGAVFDGVNRSAGVHSGSVTVPAVQTLGMLEATNLENDHQQDKLQSLTTMTILPKPSSMDDHSSTKKRKLDDKDDNESDPLELKALQRSCYVCKVRFSKLHTFYDQLCPSCAELNWSKRILRVDLKGKVGLITGARVKIGYQAGLRLLRCGASLIVTTRFPADCALRYSREHDFDSFRQNLKIVCLDLRDVRAVEEFCDHLVQKLPRLDFIINNACQTVRRPPAYYRHLLENETLVAEMFSNNTENPNQRHVLADLMMNLESSSSSSLLVSSSHNMAPKKFASPEALTKEDKDLNLFPVGSYDVNAQQVDLRTKNSWLLKLDEVSTTELLEVTAVNSIAPFIICARLKPLLVQAGKLNGSRNDGTYIVNVSAMEGKFYRRKNAAHPHTNMCKASLNMMTRTSAQDYVQDGIYMNSVDTGWVNDENPLEIASRIAEQNNFQTPIDEIDAAARITDPILTGMIQKSDERLWGKFLKDYLETEW